MRVADAAEIVKRATAPLQKGASVDLTGLEVREPLDLSGATIGNVDFTGSRFLAQFVARGATFAGLAWFGEAEFAAGFDLSRCVFCNDLRMRSAIVRGPAILSRAELRGVGDLDFARFEDRADLDGLVVHGNMSLAGPTFLGPMTMQGSELLGGLWCEGTNFARRADFRGVEVQGRTWLRHAQVASCVAGEVRGGVSDIQSYGYRWS